MNSDVDVLFEAVFLKITCTLVLTKNLQIFVYLIQIIYYTPIY